MSDFKQMAIINVHDQSNYIVLTIMLITFILSLSPTNHKTNNTHQPVFLCEIMQQGCIYLRYLQIANLFASIVKSINTLTPLQDVNYTNNKSIE